MMAALTLTAMTLGELLGPAAGPYAGTPITDLVLDSRQAAPGAAFVAVRGRREHGLEHAGDALARGAAAVLYDPASAGRMYGSGIAVPGLEGRLGELAKRFYGRALDGVELAGITGTNGKTTVAWLVAEAMSRGGARCGYSGTLGHGVPPQLTAGTLTTPDCFTLHRNLAATGASRVAVEVSSHALAQDRVAGLAFGVAAFTNLTRDHLDEHGDLDGYARAKASLFERGGLHRAVLNVTDAFGARLAERLPGGVTPIRVAAAGPGLSGAAGAPGPGAQTADIGAEVVTNALAGVELRVFGRYGDAVLRSPLIGAFNAENLLVALGVLCAWDMPLEAACDALGACSAPPGRLEVVAGGAGSATRASSRGGTPWVVVDYAHTPAGLERALDVLAGAAAGEIWCVFGCGGERDSGKRALMGRAAAAGAQHLVLTDDNPRGEDPRRIVRDILDGVGVHSSVAVEHDRRAAIALALRAAKPDDVVLIAGKGHESVQLVAGQARAFSDRDAALEILEAGA